MKTVAHERHYLDRVQPKLVRRGAAGPGHQLHASRAQIIRLAVTVRLPAIYQWPQSARDGWLVAYGPSPSAINRQILALVVRILGGAKAGDLPIEQPSRFELVINMKAAEAIGVTVPQRLRLSADEVIE